MIDGQEERAADRVGPYIVTLTGRKFYPQDVRAEDISIRDIARGLESISRWSGFTNFPSYKVTAHAIHVSRIVEMRTRKRFSDVKLVDELALAALHHDSEEGLGLCDIPRPIKHMPGMERYIELGNSVRSAVVTKYVGRDFGKDPIIKAADDDMLIIEAKILNPHFLTWAAKYKIPADYPITEWDQLQIENSERRFIDRHFDLLVRLGRL